MAEIRDFAQPDASPSYFIDFLDFLDSQPQVAKVRAEASARLRVAPGSKVLDLGCGIGGATFGLADLTGPTGLAAGVDISTALVAVATQRAANRPGIEFKVGDACALPYPDAFFDAARTERVFLYLPDRLGAIREMMRVVKPGGRVLLMDTDVDCTAIYSLNPERTRKMTSIMAAAMPNPLSARQMPKLAKQAGLKDIEVHMHAITSPYEFLARAMPDSLYKAAENGLTTRKEVDEWLAEQAALHASGDFFQMWFFVFVTGTV